MQRLFGALALAAAGPALAIQPGGTAATPPAAAPDPARLAAAERLVDLVLPAGSPMNILLGSGPSAYSMMDVRIGDLGFMSAEDRALGPDMTYGDFMSRTDPHFRERTRIMREVTDRMVREVLPNLEVDFRRAVAAMYAPLHHRRVGEMLVFFATPTGRKYAAQNLTILTDPAIAQVIMSVMPAVQRASPSLDERVRAATAHIPESQPDPGDAANMTEEAPPPPDQPPPGG